MKKSRRILSLTLVFLLMLALAGTASAATVTWQGLDGTSYFLNLTINRAYNSEGGLIMLKRDVVIEECTAQHHVKYGGDTTVYYPVPFTASYTATHSLFTYTNQLERALELEGLQYRASYTHGNFSTINIPSSYDTGSYKIAVRFSGLSGSWTLRTGVGTIDSVGAETYALGVPGNGTLTFAPNGEIAIIPYKVS